MRDLTPGFALVTGASSGIGAALVRALPPDRPLLLTALDQEGLEAMQAELARGGRPVEILAADLASDDGRQAVIDWALARPVALLVNNAGICSWGRVAETDPARLATLVRLNCLAPLLLTRALLPALLARARREGGRAGLVFVASIVAWLPLPYVATYCASKAFDRFLGEALSQELRGEPIDVLTVCPPVTRSGLADAAGIPREAPGPRPGADPAAIAAATLAALGRRSLLLPDRAARRAVWGQALVPRALLRPLLRRRMQRTAAAG